MLAKFPSGKISGTKNSLLFLSRAPTHHSLILICNSLMTWSTRFVSLKLCVVFCFFDSVSLLLKETRNTYFCVTLRNHWLMFFSWKELKSTVIKKVIVCFHTFGEENFLKVAACNIFNFLNGFVWNPSKVQRSLFERIVRFL